MRNRRNKEHGTVADAPSIRRSISPGSLRDAGLPNEMDGGKDAFITWALIPGLLKSRGLWVVLDYINRVS